MSRRHILIFALSLISSVAAADEGMWLPSLISERIEDMQAKGFELSAEDIAMTREEELPNPGLTVSFLEYMEDVTEQVLDGYEAGMTEEERTALIDANADRLIEKATAPGNGPTSTTCSSTGSIQTCVWLELLPRP